MYNFQTPSFMKLITPILRNKNHSYIQENKFNAVKAHHVINVLFPQKINTLYIEQCNIFLYNLLCDLI